MEDFKISLFESEYKITFPNYETLMELECDKLVSAIAERYNIDKSNFEEQMRSKQSYFKEVYALDGFKLLNTLNKLEIEPLSEIFLNWYQFKKIDIFTTDNLDKYFYDIWFPSSDDVDLFDESLSWILSIRHDGCVSYLK